MKFLLTPKSGNSKTGPIAVTTSSKETCPPSCPFKKSGCYAAASALNIHWIRITAGVQGLEFPDFVKGLNALPDNQLTRLNQAGDLPGKGNRINGKQLAAIVNAGKGKRFFTYTHKPVTGNRPVAKANRAYVAHANLNGTVINLSANNLFHADSLADLGIGPVATVLPLGTANTVYTPKGRKVIKCPAQVKEYVTCSTCKLCAIPNRSVIIGFEAHGVAKRKVSEIAAN